MIVVGASSWIVALLDSSARGDAARRVLASDPDWAAPAHVPLKVLRTLLRYERARTLTSEAADMFAQEVTSAQVR